MEVHRGGVGRVPIKSTGHSAPLRDGPQFCRPQNQWAPDEEVEKWEKEIQDIFTGDHHQRFEEAEILEDSKDFPTHSGVQTPILGEAIGKPKEITERRDERQTMPQGLKQEIQRGQLEKPEIKPDLLKDREEFPSLGTKLNEMGEDKQLFGKSAEESKLPKGEQRQELTSSDEKLPRHGVPLEEFIDNDHAGQPHQNIEGKMAECRSETAPDSGIHLGEALRPQVTKKQAEGCKRRFEEADILEEAKEFPAHSGVQTPVLERGQPELSPPKETDKEKEELKEVKGVIGEVKHVAEVVGAKIAHGAHEVKELLTDAVHHLTTIEGNDSASKATEQTGYNTCA